MQTRELITQLLKVKNKRDHRALLQKKPELINLGFADKLKDTYYDSWTTEPEKTRNAASALEVLCDFLPVEEVYALAAWVRGIADLTDGKLEKAIEDLDNAAEIFRKIGQDHRAAQTQVAKLIALALLGKYDESVKAGEKALKIFERFGDELAAGKVEKNIGNVVARQDDLAKSEKYYLSAIRRFEKLNDASELAMCETNLAETYAELNDFHKAEEFYAKALKSARIAKMSFVEAEIEASLGNLALSRGKYDDALSFLELSRQKFESLRVAHRSSVAELEIADIYLELNLIDEAYKIYEKVAGALRRLKLQGEEARARASFGKAARLRNEIKKAKNELEKSARLYVLEKNPNGAANVKINEAHLEFSRGRYENALATIREAEKFLSKAENQRQKVLAKWLRGEILLKLKKYGQAEKFLNEAFSEATKNEQSNPAQTCLNSLGVLAREKGDEKKAKEYFKKAVRMIETLRAPLPAEEFRMSFLADKLAPFENLAQIYIAENDFVKAFSSVEKARSRTLSENLHNSLTDYESEKSSELAEKIKDLREELNWFYSRLNRAEAGDFEKLQKETKKREKRIAEVIRKDESTRKNDAAKRLFADEKSAETEVKKLQKSLGKDKTLVEFVRFDGAISAFSINEEKIEYFADLAKENEILELLEGLQFQFGALRYGAKNLGALTSELKKRADFYLQKLYEKLIAPLKDFIAEKDLVIVPVGATHYVPFHALRRENYLIESREIVYAPSAAVWQFLQEKPRAKIENALLIGYADEQIPFVENEIDALKKIFKNAKTFTGAAASFQNFTANAADFDVLHLACHGQFRPDNPLFSSLHLADGFVTVRDICAQKLKAEIVTLSACETGLNKIFAGDEILGLSRGFLSAGAKSIILSLWTVSDEATTALMKDFYANLQRGASVAASLRQAQLNFIKNQSHPYFWSPFALIGK